MEAVNPNADGIGPQTGHFWMLTHSDDEHVRDFDGWESDPCEGSLEDFRRICQQGGRFNGDYPSGFKIWVPEGAAPLADYPVLSLPMIVFSKRLFDCLSPLIADSTQTFPAPLFARQSNEPVEGYVFVHVTRVIDCVVPELSRPGVLSDGTVYTYRRPCIDIARAADSHMFKYTISSTGVVSSVVVCTTDVGKRLEAKGFRGIAFSPICHIQRR